ncbi:hypothetical protein JD844_034021 [Phrynosoma platyrhinos]|uniref:Transducer of regulated CREB activity middle domain-containing protein n=1 Tax=Phrynosoma platyrhinos TaxID=52577 RepID=A0ABQ7T8B8_PHRPL|nr:hypothetical protein JD844_034021 [Phrynosoma platyrhinos]
MHNGVLWLAYTSSQCQLWIHFTFILKSFLLVLLLTVPGMEEEASDTDKNLSKQGWDAKKTGSSRPKSCEVPGINIFPSADQENTTTLIPAAHNTGGSLPDLTNIHFPSPLPTPLDPEESTFPSLSSSNSTGNLAANLTHMGINPANQATHWDRGTLGAEADDSVHEGEADSLLKSYPGLVYNPISHRYLMPVDPEMLQSHEAASHLIQAQVHRVASNDNDTSLFSAASCQPPFAEHRLKKNSVPTGLSFTVTAITHHSGDKRKHHSDGLDDKSSSPKHKKSSEAPRVEKHKSTSKGSDKEASWEKEKSQASAPTPEAKLGHIKSSGTSHKDWHEYSPHRAPPTSPALTSPSHAWVQVESEAIILSEGELHDSPSKQLTPHPSDPRQIPQSREHPSTTPETHVVIDQYEEEDPDYLEPTLWDLIYDEHEGIYYMPLDPREV